VCGAVVVSLVDDQGGQCAIDGYSAGHNDQQVFIRLCPVKIHLAPSWSPTETNADKLKQMGSREALGIQECVPELIPSSRSDTSAPLHVIFAPVRRAAPTACVRIGGFWVGKQVWDT